jgi:5-methylcytosine-specific restriction protein A
MGQDKRSKEGAEYQWIYTSRRWRALREKIFARDMARCAMCQAIVIGEYHVDHKTAHKGDPAMIWDESNLQVLHPSCHNSLKQHQERHGYSQAIGKDGLPLDTANHPFYK